MGSDAAITSAISPAVVRDAGGKKKRVNRSAKLKQCKLDARREQWLSQLKNKDSEVIVESVMSPSSLPLTMPLVHKPDGCFGGMNPMMIPRKEDNNERAGFLGMDSPLTSPTSSVSPNNSSIKGFPESSMSSGSYSRSVSDCDEEDEDMAEEGDGPDGDGSQDDWETVADALTANDGGQSYQRSKPAVVVPESTSSLELQKGDGILERPKPDRMVLRAWRPDDVFRPQNLPSLCKQRSVPLDLEQYYSQGTRDWDRHGITCQSSSCPICFEDLDLTDSSFLPCTCGFHLCLFCHKRILETNGRCPGCRKQYSSVKDEDSGVSSGTGAVPLRPLRLSHSHSMKTRY